MSVTRINRIVKNLEVKMKDLLSSGEDPILIVDFLSRIVEEADVLEMDEGQLMVCLRHMLTINYRFRIAI